MTRPFPLEAYPLIRTRHVDALQDTVSHFYGEVKIDVTGKAQDFDAVVNHCQLRHIGLTFANHRAPVQIALPSFGTFAQLFSMNGSARVSTSRAEVDVTPEQTFIGSMNDALRLRLGADFGQFVLNVDGSALTRKLEALLGQQLSEPIQLKPASSFGDPSVKNHYRAVLALVERLSANGRSHHPVALAEAEQAILVSFLRSNDSNYRHLLERDPRSVANWQLSLAEDFIEANWDRSLSIEALVGLTGVSARSLFYYFEQARGCSPMAFAKLTRLRHAHRRLSQPDEMTSVTDVAYACGFGNLGHFAGYYRQEFGESPSETLKRHRRAV